jgi:Protein of unknown function (DUF2800)
MKHSPLGASSMDRWSQCPASVKASEGKPERTNAYAEEGTLAHGLAAQWFRSHFKPKFPNKEMEEHVTSYYEYIQASIEPGDKVLIECCFDLSSVFPGAFGTADAVIWKPEKKRLKVTDFKYGEGIPVSAENNPQLQYYALGAMLTMKVPAETVEMVIYQPRLELNGDEGVRSTVINAIDLLDFMVDLRTYAEATQQPDAPFHPGYYCRYCLANPGCPALDAATQELAKTSFAPGVVFTPEQLRKALDKRDAIRAALTSLDEFAYAAVEAGMEIPGYKMVAKRATRKWKNDDDVKKLLANDLGNAMFAPQELKSPAQMETIVPKEMLAPYIEAISSGNVLVDKADKRPAVKKLTAAEVFA